MDVKYLGFSLTTEGNGDMSLEELCNFIQQDGHLKFENESSVRELYIDATCDDVWYRGLVVTIKNQKRYCKMMQTAEGPSISVENLKGRDRLLDFNFFIIKKSNGIGLYQHYHQSCAMNLLGGFLKKAFKNLNDSEISYQISIKSAEEGGSVSKRQASQIRSKHLAKLKYSPLVKQEQLEKILAEYERIKFFEFEYATLSDDVKKATPLSKYVRLKREKLTFKAVHDQSLLGQAIAEFVGSEKPKSGRVMVEDDLGDTHSLKIFNMPDCFGSEDFEKVIVKLDGLKVASFSTHAIFNDLISIAESEDYEHIFETEIEYE